MNMTPDDLARWLGTHALAGYFLLLAACLVAAAGAWAAARRWGVPREDSRLPPAAFLLLHYGIGFGIIVGGAMFFAEIADELGDGRTLGHLDQVFSDAVRAALPPLAERGFYLVTRFGDTATLTTLGIVVGLVLVWRRRLWLALGWATALLGNALLNTTLKQVFERVRPVHDGSLEQASGFSFPSGHTSGSLVAYGMLAYLAVRFVPRPWQLPAVLAAAAIAFSTGWSRVFLQVHYATDVLAGFASGSAWLVTCIVSIEALRRRRRALRG